MISLATGIDYVDLNFLGYPNIIATAVLHGPGGVALIDPGPSTSLTTLRSTLERSGIGMADVRQILLTHIHLDHAGCTGTLVKENPSIDVFVHERGAMHLADPTKLLSSATRLYGQDMDRLWGEFLPVPRERLRELKGGETIPAGGRTLQVAYTPGHASHHVSYFEPSTRIAFVGDTAGIRRGTGNTSCRHRRPPTSISSNGARARRRILGWEPDTLFLTHFGPFNGARQHFHELMSRMDEWGRTARRLVARRAPHGGGA